MLKRMIMAFLLVLLPLLISCDNTAGSSSDSTTIDPQEQADSLAAFEAFNDAFGSSAEDYVGDVNDLMNIDSVGDLIKTVIELDGSVWLDNAAIKALIDLGISNASPESIEALIKLINDAVLNPWTLLDQTSLNGKHGCVSWSTGVDFDLQLTQALTDYFDSNWWTLAVQVKLDDCSDVSGDFKVEIAGSKLGVVYTVHVTGDLTVASMPDKVFTLDILYDLEDALGEWDSVDWSGTINGIEISDLY